MRFNIFVMPSSKSVSLEPSYFHLIGNGSLCQETTEVAKPMTGRLAQDLQAVASGRETIHFSGKPSISLGPVFLVVTWGNHRTQVRMKECVGKHFAHVGC